MSNASSTLVTRCPKCTTAFRITSTLLDSAKGAVRCGSCLHIFRAQDYLVTPTDKPDATPPAARTTATPKKPDTAQLIAPKAAQPAATSKQSPAQSSPTQPTKTAAAKATTVTKAITGAKAAIDKPAASKPEALSMRPAPTSSFSAPTPQKTAAKPAPVAANKPTTKTFSKSSLDQIDDLLISDEMDEPKAQKNAYEFDGFMEIDTKPQLDVSLFEHSRSNKREEELKSNTDESWAEMLLDEEDEKEMPNYSTARQNAANTAETAESLAQEETNAAIAHHQAMLDQAEADSDSTPPARSQPGLMFSIVGDNSPSGDTDLSDEMSSLPSTTAIGGQRNAAEPSFDANLFESPSESEKSTPSPAKAEPKIRAYDNSRSALLMNIIPAPVEFTSKRMRSWSQKKLWPTLSFIALIALVIQVSWFKFDYLSRIEPYRTAYTYICPYLGCKVPTLVDTNQIKAYQVTVRPLQDVEEALLVDLMILNGAPFDQPYPDLVLAFMDMDEKPVASRRFTPKEYLGGELAGSKLMPHNQPIHLTLDLADPGPNAINYKVYIP